MKQFFGTVRSCCESRHSRIPFRRYHCRRDVFFGRFATVLVSVFLLLSALLSPVWAESAQDFAPHQVIVRLRTLPAVPSKGLTAFQFNQLPADVTSLLISARAKAIFAVFNEKNLRKIRTQADIQKNNRRHELEALIDQQARTFLLELEKGQDVLSVVSQLGKNPIVEYATPNYTMRFLQSPDDTFYPTQWGLSNTGQAGSQDGFDPPTGTAGGDIDAELAWDSVTGSAAVVVAVIDTGVQWSHPDLSVNIWSNTGEIAGNSLDDDGNGYVDDVRGWDFGDVDNDPDDDCFNPNPILDAGGHGTHVSGIIGAVGNNSLGVAGTGWGLNVMPLKVADNACLMFTTQIAEAVNYSVANQAKVINMSLGNETSDPTLQTAVNAANAAGAVVVAAAGNSDNTTEVYPAAYSTVIGVVATDRNDQKGSFSTYGSWVSLSAPGVAIRSTLPTGDGSYGYASGTSMASPMTAGVAALVFSRYPSLTSAEVTTRLTNSCENIDSLNPSYTGLLGAGRVNAARALMSLTSVTPPNGAVGNSVTLNLTGISFVPGLTVTLLKSGQPNITATNVVLNGPTSLSCQVDLTGADLGVWDISVNIGQTTYTLTGAFTVESLSLSSVTPSRAANTGPVVVSLAGQNFVNGMTATLQRNGWSSINGTGLIVDTSLSATVSFDLTGATGGRWDVVISASNISSTLSEGFIVASNVFDVVFPSLTSDNTFSLSPTQGTQIIRWPAGTTDQQISLELNATPSFFPVDSTKDPYAATGVGLELSPTPASVTFLKSHTLTLGYRLVDLPDSSIESALTLAVYNTTTGRWEPISSVVDTNQRTVSASVSHASLFQILQHVPSSNLNKVIAFPNPFRSDQGHNRVVFDFLTAGSRLRIFDISGQLIRDLDDDNNDGQIVWPATNESGEKVASGMYMYLATDQDGNKKPGRLGIIR